MVDVSRHHLWSPPYERCARCGKLPRQAQEPCEHERLKASREARSLIKQHAQMTWKTGQIERSDGITEVLVEFDRMFPEVLGR